MTHFKNSNNEEKLIVSDGTNNLYHVNKETFKVEKVLPVLYANGVPMNELNE